MTPNPDFFLRGHQQGRCVVFDDGAEKYRDIGMAMG